jgi:sugar/nucleoside kinase (ribokinase family)
MRRWGDDGQVLPAPWESAESILPHADAVVLSEEDVGGDVGLIARWAEQTRILALTRGARGCRIYVSGRAQDIPAPQVTEVDPTGAGDVFAAIFFTQLWQGGDPWSAARTASCIAAASVTRRGMASVPTQEEIARCQAACS